MSSQQASVAPVRTVNRVGFRAPKCRSWPNRCTGSLLLVVLPDRAYPGLLPPYPQPNTDESACGNTDSAAVGDRSAGDTAEEAEEDGDNTDGDDEDDTDGTDAPTWAMESLLAAVVLEPELVLAPTREYS